MKFLSLLAPLASFLIASTSGGFQTPTTTDAWPSQPATPSSQARDEQPRHKTRNVILCVADGLRWQEVFTGADESLFNEAAGKIKDDKYVRDTYWRSTPEERRETLMPFLWSVVAKNGIIYGDRTHNAPGRVTNDYAVSYPGYSELFCGFPEPVIKDNKRIYNPNVTVFEWLNSMKEFNGRVVAFTTWDLFPWILNVERSKLPVDDGIMPCKFGRITPRIEFMNRLRAETPRRWSGSHFDSMTFHVMMDWVEVNRPRVMFFGLGETDEWAHEADYERYLDAARRTDDYWKSLWEMLQKDPQYKDQTTIIFTCDHGRGDNTKSPDDWSNHGAKHPGSDQWWVAVMGPDTPATGVVSDHEMVTQSQVAATLARALGHDWCKQEPRAGKPLEGAVKE